MEQDLEIFSDDKVLLRKAILRGMARCAIEVHDYYKNGPALTNLIFPHRCPLAFKPGVGDKYIFNRIIDEVIENIAQEDRHLTNEYIVGAAVMGNFYYPEYEKFDRSQ
jgi:hypothetical protein